MDRRVKTHPSDSRLLGYLSASRTLSLSELAEAMGYRLNKAPDKNRVRRQCEKLVRHGQAWKNRDGKFRSISTKFKAWNDDD